MTRNKATPGNQGVPSRPKAVPKGKPVAPKRPTMLQVTRSTLVLNLIIGAVRMMGGVSFWWIVAQGYVFVALAFCEVVLEPDIKRRKALQVVLIILVIGAGTWFTVSYVRATAPLTIASYVPGSRYGTGTTVNGVLWNDAWTDLRTRIRNDSDEDYRNLDIQVKTGHGVFKAKELTGIGCRLLPSEIVTGVVGNTDDAQTPLGPDAVSNGIFYHIRCDTLPRHSTVEVLMAVGDMDTKVAPVLPMVDIRGQYDGGFRTRRVAAVLRPGESYATR